MLLVMLSLVRMLNDQYFQTFQNIFADEFVSFAFKNVRALQRLHAGMDQHALTRLHAGIDRRALQRS